ncbi:hypothetical protein FBU59_004859, partial [Linderina macrospora]
GSGYGSWFGFKASKSEDKDVSPQRTRVVCLRFTADRGRGLVVEALWSTMGAGAGAQAEEQLVFPETLLDPQRAPVLLEIKVPNTAGQLTVNWRIANLDEGLAPYPSVDEAKIPIQLEYSFDPEEELLAKYGVPAVKREA